MSKKETLKEKIYEAIGSSANVVGIINQSLATQKVLKVISEEQGGRQTAVEWLVEQIMKHDKSFLEFYGAEIEQAKQMEKQQMKDAALCSSTKHPIFRKLFEEQFEQYYKKTFKKD
jgi:stalled ribosome alternative rescue factor ArfA